MCNRRRYTNPPKLQRIAGTWPPRFTFTGSQKERGNHVSQPLSLATPPRSKSKDNTPIRGKLEFGPWIRVNCSIYIWTFDTFKNVRYTIDFYVFGWKPGKNITANLLLHPHASGSLFPRVPPANTFSYSAWKELDSVSVEDRIITFLSFLTLVRIGEFFQGGISCVQYGIASSVLSSEVNSHEDCQRERHGNQANENGMAVDESGVKDC